MRLERSLLDIAKLLLSEGDSDKTAEILLRRVLQATGSERGFIVLKVGGGYVPKFDVRFNLDAVSQQERRFSRSLVRKAIETHQLVESRDVLRDPAFAEVASLVDLGARSVVAAPLPQEGEVYGVVYVESQSHPNGFGKDEKAFLAEFVEIAGASLRRVLEREALEQRNRGLERDLFARYNFEGIVTRHPEMLRLLEVVAQVADTDSTILVLGETGTGKELIARALHLNGSRSKKPFVSLHCTALPGTILESELFGHTRGAFTGAERERPGRIASAEGGTLLLDEVAEIPLELQAKLLRFLQFGEIQRLGSDRVEKVDVRIVAATHQDLPALVKSGKFRQDLYYRLKVLELRVPALRDRRSDIPLLVNHFLRQYWRRPDSAGRFTAQAEQALYTYSYPGNVRELQHVVERACLLARGPELGVDMLPDELQGRTAPAVEFTELSHAALKAAREGALAAVDRQFLEALLKSCDGNISRASRESGIHRSQLQRLLAAHGMSADKGDGEQGS